MSGGKAALGLVLLLAVGVGLVLVRDATISRDLRSDPQSRTEVLFEVDKQLEPAHTAEDVARALVQACRFHVDADLVAPLEQVDSDRFRIVLQPALDATDRLQLRGCMEDTIITHVLGEVLHIGRATTRDSEKRRLVTQRAKR